MLTTIPHLAKPQQEQLAQLILSIVQSVEPEKIICYGSRVTIMQDWGCFLDQVGYKETIHPTFDLLIITKENEKRFDHEIVQIAEQQCRPPASVTCIVRCISFAGQSTCIVKK